MLHNFHETIVVSYHLGNTFAQAHGLAAYRLS